MYANYLQPGLTIQGDNAVYVHRQTTERFAIAPDSWDLIPVGHDAPPAVILEDVARGYRDIGDQWRVLTWWLCRVHGSSALSAMPILGYANYVLVLENDYVNFGRRPHGLIELVCADDSFLFPTVRVAQLAPSSSVLGTHLALSPFWYGYDGFLQWRQAQSTPCAMWQWILCPGSLHLHIGLPG